MAKWEKQEVYLIGVRYKDDSDIPFQYFSGTKDGFFLSERKRLCIHLRRAMRFDTFADASEYIVNLKHDKYTYDVVRCVISA